MSGIAGIVAADGGAIDLRLLERMAGALAFRGPDGCCVWSRPGAAFCLSFLRTGPAPQAAQQPVTLDERVWLLADARLDARDDLRRTLAGKGCTLSDQSTDEELILQAWREWGESCLDRVRGDFALVVWDSESRELWCARDLMGIKPFYYAQAGRSLHFSNTLDVLRLGPAVGDSLDPHAIGDFLLQGWCSHAERTAFCGVRRLPAGHLLRFVDGEVHVRRHTELPIEEPLRFKRPEEYISAFREAFEAAVHDRLPRDSAVVFLSGGLDSSSVACVAKSHAERDAAGCRLRALTVDYSELFADEEAGFAARAASFLGIPLETLPASSNLPYAQWGTDLIEQPEPCHEPFYAQQLEEYRHASKHARVAFSGDGGDSVLSGQAWPHLVDLVRRHRLRELLGTFGGYLLAQRRLPVLRGGFRTRIRRWLGRGAGPDEHYPTWLNPEFERDLKLRDRWKELQRPPESAHPLHPLGFAGLASSFWPGAFEMQDAAWMRVPVELRAPLLDWRVLSFLLRLPPVPWCMDKYVLRKTMRGRLPDEILRRPKTSLLGDPLLIHYRAGDWNPLPLPAAAPEIEAFVDWAKLEGTLERANPELLWCNLSPVSLNYWLKKR